jgi:hypothetical protein
MIAGVVDAVVVRCRLSDRLSDGRWIAEEDGLLGLVIARLTAEDG